jgi:hypothetical protein
MVLPAPAQLVKDVDDTLVHFKTRKICYRHLGRVVQHATEPWLGVVRAEYRDGMRLIDWMQLYQVHTDDRGRMCHAGWSVLDSAGQKAPDKPFNFHCLSEGWDAQLDRWQDEADAQADRDEERAMGM